MTVSLVDVRIDRYFPECKSAAIEAAARSLFGIADFGKIYGWHAFRYRRPPGPVRFLPNGVQLDLHFHRAEIGDDALEHAIESVYGVRAATHRIEQLGRHRALCEEVLAQGEPLLIDFDLKFIKQRREYGKVDNPHIVLLYGRDASKASFLASEQMLGGIEIDDADFDACIAEKLERTGVAEVWRVERLGATERELTREEVAERVRSNLENLDASNSELGLSGLTRFQADMAEYLASHSFDGRPFAVPGLWVFSHERHVEQRWLRAAARVLGPASEACVASLADQCASLFKRWLAADYLIEKCLAAEDGAGLRALPKHLEAIVDEERRAAAGWRVLADHLAPSRG